MTALLTDPWLGVRDGDPRVLALYQRHYSCYHYRDGRRRTRIVGPGERLVLLTPECDALLVWRKFRDASGQSGVNCAIFRNEGPRLSSDLLRAGMHRAWQRWPRERLYTYVNPRRIRSTNPGYCFLMAGWQRCGWTQARRLLILEAYPPGGAQ